MRRLSPITCFVSCVCGTILLGGVWRGTAQENSKTAQKRQRNTQVEQRLAELPIVDFNETDNTAANNPARAAKNKRHNSPASLEGVKRPKLNENMEAVLLDLPLSHQPAEPALPVASDVIVLGTIADTQAYLSSDRTGVYSEVSVSIEDILKGNPLLGLTIGGSLIAERTGGAVRFPSGKILRRAQLGKNLPSKANRYLLFLNQTGDGGFSIATGYELTGNGVVPLDGVPGPTLHQFKNYETFKNATEASLLDAVRKALSQNGTGSGDA